MAEYPAARTDGLIATPLGDELMVYDQRNQRSHALSATAAAVWGACDGARSHTQIAANCGLEPVTVVRALAELLEYGLLIPADTSLTARTISRR